MDHNTIAIIWDFDKTLTPGYMQDPIFDKYGIDAAEFWTEVDSLTREYAKQGIHVNPETIYLNHMITCTQQGIFKGLDNKALKELGKKIPFYPGVPDVFKKLKDIIDTSDKYKRFGIHVEHYIVSTGFTAMIEGSAISDYVEGIWGCEFIEKPILSRLSGVDPGYPAEISQMGYIVDNTSKTRAIFEINKGANVFDYIDVNSRMDDDARRVPFSNMIYIADGPSDVPAFSILRQHGGHTFAIYPKGDTGAFKQVDALRKDDRIDMYAEADYTEGSAAFMWLAETAKDIAEEIFNASDKEIRTKVKNPPRHLNTEGDD